MGQRTNERLESIGITAADRAVLEFLYPNHELTVPEIAKRYDVSRQHIQVTINRLAEKGLVVSKINPNHKRSSVYCLSVKGRAFFSVVLEEDLVLIESWFKGVTAKDTKNLVTSLTLLLGNISSEIDKEV